MNLEVLSQIGNFLLGVSIIFVGLYYYSYNLAVYYLKDDKKAKFIASEIIYNLFVDFLIILTSSYLLIKNQQSLLIFLSIIVIIGLLRFLLSIVNFIMKIFKKESKTLIEFVNTLNNYEIHFYLILIFLTAGVLSYLIQEKYNILIYLGVVLMFATLIRSYVLKRIQEFTEIK